MTPGTYEGEHFDGVMRNLRFNHVALVREGRAGPDVVVQDENPFFKRMDMNIKLTPKGAVAQGALIAYLRPRLAQDKKIDLRPMLKGVSAKTWKADKPRLAADIKRQAKPLMAKDANVDDVMELLDALEEVIPEMEVEQLGSVSSVDNDAPDAEDSDDSALRDFLKSLGLSDEDVEKACSMASPTAAMDAPDPGNYESVSPDDPNAAPEAAVVSAPGGSTGRGETTAASTTKDPIVTGDKRIGKDKDMVTKTAMDAAIASAVATAAKIATDSANRNQREIREAFDAVRPHVGNLVIAADRAADVYKGALECKKIAFDGLPPAAFKPLFENVMTAAAEATKKPAPVAMDAAVIADYKTRFPNAARLKN